MSENDSTGSDELDKNIRQEIEKFERWVEQLPDMEESSAENYATSVRGFYKEMGYDKSISGNLDDETFIEEVSRDIGREVTSESRLYGLKKFFNWVNLGTGDFTEQSRASLIMNKLDSVSDNITVDEKNVGDKIVTHEKVMEIINKSPERTRGQEEQVWNFLKFMYDTACRIGEVKLVKWKHLERDEYEGKELEDREVFIPEHISKSDNSGVVEISDEVLLYLQMHDEYGEEKDERIFFSDKTPLGSEKKARRAFNNAAAEAGVRYPEAPKDSKGATPHWFRHSRLTHLGFEMLEDGKSYPEIKERLRKYARHENDDTTEKYIKVIKNRKAESVYKYSKKLES